MFIDLTLYPGAFLPARWRGQRWAALRPTRSPSLCAPAFEQCSKKAIRSMAVGHQPQSGTAIDGDARFPQQPTAVEIDILRVAPEKIVNDPIVFLRKHAAGRIFDSSARFRKPGSGFEYRTLGQLQSIEVRW